MRLLREKMCALPIALAGFCLAFSAHAELLVVTTAEDPDALAHAEVAFATGEGETITWLSLRVRRGPVAVVAALADSATGEPALDAWLTALEQTASPNVLVPRGRTDCGKTSSFVHVRWPRSPGVSAEELTLSTPEDVAVALSEHGLGEGLRLPPAPRYVVWNWPKVARDQTTRALRVSGEGSRLSFTRGARWPVLVNVLSRGPSALPEEVGIDQLRVTFVAGKPGSDYVERLHSWRERERRPLLETRAQGAIFGWSVLAAALSVPPLVRTYARFAAEERDDVDAEGCAAELSAFEGRDASGATTCGSATDASVALEATGAHPTLQRFVVSASEPLDAGAFLGGGEPRAAVLRAASLDDGACPPLVTEAPPSLPPTPSGGEPPGRGGSASVSGPEETIVVDEPCPSESRSCRPSPEPDYSSRGTVHCSSDTSSSSGDDSCSSDTSSSSGDDSCSSDTSSSSGDDSCSSDTSSSSGDDSCGGGSDRSYDGDTCTGRAAPGAEPEPARAGLMTGQAERPRRLKLSLWSLGFAAALLPIRRRKRAGVR